MKERPLKAMLFRFLIVFLLFAQLGTLNIQDVLHAAQADWAVGSGLAIDLGGEFRPNPKWMLFAQVNDLGGINWKKDTRTRWPSEC